MRWPARLVLSIFFAVVLAWQALAAEYDLFPNGKISPDYATLVAKIEPGDTVRFGKNTVFTIVRKLGEGNMDAVFEIPGRKAIRIARVPWRENHHQRDSITEFLRNARWLKRRGIPIVEVDTRNSVAGKFALVEVRESSRWWKS